MVIFIYSYYEYCCVFRTLLTESDELEATAQEYIQYGKVCFFCSLNEMDRDFRKK